MLAPSLNPTNPQPTQPRSTGERNGLVATGEEEFRDLHLTTPNLCLMRIRERATGALVTFCTGVRVGGTLIAMWVGSDYALESSRRCSTYFNLIYEVVRVGIEDPAVGCIDLGAAHRSVKIALGFKPEPIRWVGQVGYKRGTGRGRRERVVERLCLLGVRLR
jgi:hypothetical protein